MKQDDIIKTDEQTKREALCIAASSIKIRHIKRTTKNSSKDSEGYILRAMQEGVVSEL